MLSVDPIRKIYSADPENRESLSSQGCIIGTGHDIPPMLIIAGQRILAKWFQNNLLATQGTLIIGYPYSRLSTLTSIRVAFRRAVTDSLFSTATDLIL